MKSSFENMTNGDLLCAALGSDFKSEPKSLLELFGIVLTVKEGFYAAEDRANYQVLPKIAAFKELYLRAMNESMASTNCFDNPELIKHYLRGRIAYFDNEVFGCLFLNSNNELIKDEILFTGTLTQTSVYPREVIKMGLAYNTASVVFYHNHPSGVANPSRADECLTSTLKTSLALVDVRVLDHFIVTTHECVSMATRGLM